MPDTAARRRAIRRLVQAEEFHSQSELVTLLEKEGFGVTQATVSRDLGALGIGKDGNGYHLRPQAATGVGLGRAIATYGQSITSSLNLVVIKTGPGAAQVVAAAIDAESLDGVLGSVAGDDTVLVVCADPAGGAAVKGQLEAIGGSS